MVVLSDTPVVRRPAWELVGVPFTGATRDASREPRAGAEDNRGAMRRLGYVGRESFSSAAPSLFADAAIDVRSRRRSFPSIASITDNSIDPARRAWSGWVVSSVISIRSALRSVSTLPTARLS